jgi:hypothetical protein
MTGLEFYGLYQFYLNNTAQRSPENVVRAYYDAIDFKEFEKAHSYLDPVGGVSLAQYMLEISVNDGILSSYAKLDSIGVEIIRKSSKAATANINTVWITPLETIKKEEVRELVMEDNEWFIVPTPPQADIPPDQLFTANTTSYYNHGRRRITTQQTHHEDVLEQPVLEVLSASLVRSGSEYVIVGELQNIDHVPADVVIQASLYNEQDEELTTYNAMYHIKHKLLPKEITSFRINFESIAWTTKESKMPETYDPDEFTPVNLTDVPVKFNLQIAANVAITDLYNQVALQDLTLNEKNMEGVLFNAGNQEVTIPQLLISYYDASKNLVWVDHSFVPEGIRIQRKQSFDYEFLDLKGVTVINRDITNCFVNGLPNAQISAKVFPNRALSHPKEQLLEHTSDSFDFIKIELNHFIGNPK